MGAAVDFTYLEGFAAGDSTVVREVLALFLEQAVLWHAGISAPDQGWRDLAHTIKGTARGIGAGPLGDVASEAEHGGPDHAPLLAAALTAAVVEVRAYLAG